MEHAEGRQHEAPIGRYIFAGRSWGDLACTQLGERREAVVPRHRAQVPNAAMISATGFLRIPYGVPTTTAAEAVTPSTVAETLVIPGRLPVTKPLPLPLAPPPSEL